jgi:hypothetical protein
MGHGMGVLSKLSCPACKSKKIEAFISYALFPAILFPIEDWKWNRVSEAPLESCFCNTCGHIFLINIDEDFTKTIYRDYYYLYPFKSLESMHEPYRRPFEKVADIFLSRKNASLLEIGCDDIAQVKPFISRGYKCTVINPGAAPSKEVHFINGFYGGGADVAGRFDYILSRFNLEHVMDLDKFFDAIEKNIARHGIVIIQVPNVASFLKLGALNILAHEHIHYFCQKSLHAFIKRRGFDILHISDESSPSLICVFRKLKSQYRPKNEIKKNVETLKQIRSLLVEYRDRSVLFYGAGLSLTAILYSSAIEPSLLSSVQIIDDNPVLKNRFMPNTRLKIRSLDEVDISSIAVVVLTLSGHYHEKAIKKIRSAGVSASVYAVNEKGLLRVL